MKRIIATLLVAIMLVPTASLTAGEGMWIPLAHEEAQLQGHAKRLASSCRPKTCTSVNHGCSQGRHRVAYRRLLHSGNHLLRRSPDLDQPPLWLRCDSEALHVGEQLLGRMAFGP